MNRKKLLKSFIVMTICMSSISSVSVQASKVNSETTLYYDPDFRFSFVFDSSMNANMVGEDGNFIIISPEGEDFPHYSVSYVSNENTTIDEYLERSIAGTMTAFGAEGNHSLIPSTLTPEEIEIENRTLKGIAYDFKYSEDGEYYAGAEYAEQLDDYFVAYSVECPRDDEQEVDFIMQALTETILSFTQEKEKNSSENQEATFSLGKRINNNSSFDIASNLDFLAAQAVCWLENDYFELDFPLDGLVQYEVKDANTIHIFYESGQTAYPATILTITAYDLDDHSYIDLPEYAVMGKDEEKCYVAIFPTDFPLDSSNQEIIDGYLNSLAFFGTLKDTNTNSIFRLK